MGKNGVESSTRWIGLDALPRMYGGNKSSIDWIKSKGYVLAYQYDGISGNINIVDVIYRKASDGKRKVNLIITIDKYVPNTIEVSSSTLTNCRLCQYVKNKIIDKAPHLIQYLANPEDAYKYAYSSGKYISTKCPRCGHIEDKTVTNLYCAGFFCPCCSDNISLPNKMMRSILQQLKINFVPEADNTKGLRWIPNKCRYDFYFQLDNKQDVLIEMDGFYHDFDEQKEMDEIKTRLAKENHFKLIRVDCRYKDHLPFDYIKKQIFASELSGILDLHAVDWEKCREVMKTSLLVSVCELWEKEHMAVCSITKQLKLGHATVVRYLKVGRDLGLCPSYDVQEAYRRRRDIVQKPILVTDNLGYIYVFESTECALALFPERFGIIASKSGLNTACRSHGVYKKLKVKYITKEEYEQYKMINNNEVVLKEAI